MKSTIRIALRGRSDETARLEALQRAFAQVCNALSPAAQRARLWNRVALHHLHYRRLREMFPAMGSQMVCNAIYAVSRNCRIVYTHPESPYNLARWGERPLPLLRFDETSPVYFDRHTLSLREGQLSLYTLDGRMRIAVALSGDQLAQIAAAKVREIQMYRSGPNEPFELSIHLDQLGIGDEDGLTPEPASASAKQPIPDYVSVEDAAS